MKDSFYFKHDYNARGDEKATSLRMKMGAEGYGIYWLVIEKLYESDGVLASDFDSIAWSVHAEAKKIKSVVENFGLFKVRDGKITCDRVTRDLEARRGASEQSRAAGRASAAQRALNSKSTIVERPLNDRSTTVQPGEERRGEERIEEDKTTARTPAAVDLSKLADQKSVKKALSKTDEELLNIQVPFGDHRGRKVIDLPANDCAFLLENAPRLGLDLRRALEARVALKKSESIT